jgi:ubiquinone/menaquinone biosynthesis C-methylase UbiE
MKNDHRFWDRIARKYAAQPVADEAAYETKLNKTREYFTPESRVLEFGCGTGTTAIRHAPYVKEIVATDVSSRMIEIAWARAEEAGVENVHFEAADFDNYEAPVESFDMVMAHSILHLLADRDAAIAKAHHLLKPGGVFVSSTVCLGDGMGWIALIVPFARALGLFPRVKVFKETALRRSIESAGFEIVYRWRADETASKFGAVAVFLVARKAG